MFFLLLQLQQFADVLLPEQQHAGLHCLPHKGMHEANECQAGFAHNSCCPISNIDADVRRCTHSLSSLLLQQQIENRYTNRVVGSLHCTRQYVDGAAIVLRIEEGAFVNVASSAISRLIAQSPQDVAGELVQRFAATAAERDERGGTPKEERDALRASGLLALSIPTEFGGSGADWSETLNVVRLLAQADSSIAHVFGFHHLMLATVRLFSRAEQWQPWFEQTARRRWFWGNALNPLDERTVASIHDGWHEFTGQKSLGIRNSRLMKGASNRLPKAV